MNLVLLETSGNQRYIFATNKLRENVGASELTYQVGTKSVLEAVGKSYEYETDSNGNNLRKLLLNEGRIEASTDADAVEIIVATSGKAILITQNKPKAEEIICEVTKRAVIEMPGLTIHGAICEVKPDLTDIHKAIGEAHRRLEEKIRYSRPVNEQRFLRLPFVAPCATSGLPASREFEFRNARGTDTYAFSEVTVAKRNVLEDAGKKHKGEVSEKKGRIIDLLEKTFELALPRNLEEFEEAFPHSDWLAVIHADGNGLGEIFLNFDQPFKKAPGADDLKDTDEAREYLDTYRKFSIALDICTINATVFALKTLQNLFIRDEVRHEVPIIPLILGGDDLTVLCDGRYALKFTKDFLTQFEKETEKISTEFTIEGIVVPLDYVNEIIGAIQGIIPKVVNNTYENKDRAIHRVKHLGICAGIAIIKPHYPFHQAYDLAEQLLRSAKQVKTEVVHSDHRPISCSALDFHILYDSAHSELSEIRDGKLKVADKTYLCAKPYVVTETLDGQEDNEWLTYRWFEELQKRVEAMSAPATDDATRQALPNSKLHEIRQSLFRGKEVADAEATLVKNRLSPSKKESEAQSAKEIFEKEILIEEKTLFFTAAGKSFTHFLDAIEAVDFWEGFGSEETTPSAGSNGQAEPSAEKEVTQ